MKIQCINMHLSIIFLIFAVAISGSYSNHVRTKRMYGLCPPNFYRIGSLCYFISREKLNWLDAHFECKDKNSKLAEPGKITDRQLRKYLMAADESRDEIWIGGSYEWNQNKWRWGYSGNDIKYQSFSQMDPRGSQNLQYHCAALNPEIKYRWSARPCVDAHRFICQHKMPKVSARNREKVYTRWNETYPHQMANEVVLEVVDGGRLPRNQRRRKPAAQNSTLESNSMPASSQPLSDQSSPSVATTQPTSLDKPGHKRSQWSPVRINGPRPNGLNNETIEKPRRKTDFDKIAERKRQKEIRRRKRIQERKKQKATEAERIRKENEAARERVYDSQIFPQPVTEILMIPEIISDRVVTTTTQRINLNVEDRKEFFPFVEKEDEKEIESSSTEKITTTTSSSNKDDLPEKRDSQTIAPVLTINTPPEKYDEYIGKLEERDKEELERIKEEQRKRETLKKQRSEEMDRLKELAEEQRKEEQRLAEEIKKHQEEDRKIKEEEERVRQEKAQKEAEDKKIMLEKQAARMEVLRKYKEKLRRQKEEKLNAALAGLSSENMSNNSNNNENETETSASPASAKPTDITEEEKKIRLQMLRDRLSKLTPEQRKRFHELRMQRKREKQKRSHLVNKRSVKKSIP